MKNTYLSVLTLTLAVLAFPAFAKEYTIKQISDPAGDKPYYFAPNQLKIQPGDTVHFVNAQDDMHDVMFVEVPKGVNEMIMSPLHEKEGETFSYRFTVPGTYQFHCHPHEGLGMHGTLIVGRASKPGETVKMDHHKMSMKQDQAKPHDHAAASGHHDHATAASAPVDATGKVNQLDQTDKTINITHDPIKALSWPKMKMEFTVADGVDLSGIKPGDSVTFTLKPEGEDNYVVVKISKSN